MTAASTLTHLTPVALDALLARMAGRRVLCVGDLILDRFVYGSAGSVSREAPVVSLNQSRIETMLGAAGNVARNVASLGGAVTLAGVVGDDAEGHEALALLEAAGFAEVDVVTAARPTPLKTRYVAGGQQVLCVDRDPQAPLDAPAAAALVAAAESAMAHAEIVLLSDYARGAVTPEVSRGVIAAARARGLRVVVDPRGRDFSRYDGAFLIKPNALELSTEAGAACGDDEEAAAALETVLARTPEVEHLLVTRSAKGMMLLSRGGEARAFAAEARDVYDVSGAGDTTLAALGLALAADAPLAEAIDVAMRAGGVVVSKVGTATTRPKELIEDALGRRAASAPVASLEEAQELAARWRANGLRVGLTNGCFDILHVGHLAALEQARRECDRLVVGVNADASVRRLKGAGRPVNVEDERARLIAALGPVDAAVIFTEDDAGALVTAIQPDVYVKGGDYRPEDLPEAAAARACGARIVITPLVEGRSTTRLIERLNAPA